MNYFLDTDNIFIAKGRLAKEPIINVSSETGNIVVGIVLAQKKKYKDENGNYQTVFIEYMANDTANTKIASRLAEYVTKGSLVTLQGFHDSYKKDGKYFQVNKITDFRSEENKEQVINKRNSNKEN